MHAIKFLSYAIFLLAAPASAFVHPLARCLLPRPRAPPPPPHPSPQHCSPCRRGVSSGPLRSAADGTGGDDGVDDDFEHKCDELTKIKAREADLRAQLLALSDEKRAVLLQRRLRIGIVGFGNFGQFLAKTFVRDHDVYVCSRSDRSDEAKALGCVTYHPLTPEGAARFLEQPLDVLVLATSIVSFEATLDMLPLERASSRNLVICDVLSVKEHPRDLLLAATPTDMSVVCTHPMFGPESGRNGWQGLRFVYDRVRIVTGGDGEDCSERFLSIFETEGCEMVEMGCEKHDEHAANSQFITHLMGRLLGTEGLTLQTTPINTKGFESMIRLCSNVGSDSFDLFYGLYKYSRYSKSTMLELRKAMADLELRLIQRENADIAREHMAHDEAMQINGGPGQITSRQ